jgi:ABC-2 type transport system ATP-binding protein
MLNFRGITKIFKSDLIAQPFVALNEVSFVVPSGSMVGFLGANGAGKTTSLKIIMDFIRADKGTVEFSKHLGSSRNEIFKKIGFLPERPYFYPNLTGEEFIQFMGTLSEMKQTEVTAALKKWGPRFKIDHALKRPLKTYSKGMLQRIGFLATIAHEPEFIILDEPLSGLDPIGRKELKDVIVEVHRQGKTVFFSSHIVPDIEEICDRVVFLKEGKLVYDGEVDKLLRANSSETHVVKFTAPSDLVIETSYRDRQVFPGNLVSVVVTDEEKTNLLKELVGKGIEIRGVEPVKPSLEEIFYQTRGTSHEA